MDLLLNHVYKPRRILYYIPATEEEKKNFFLGIVPDSLLQFDGAFGTYDCPGLFKIKLEDGLKEVIGIEFRPNDNSITYPKDLDYYILRPSFMVAVSVTNDFFLDDEQIQDCVDFVQSEMTDHPHRVLKPQKNPSLVQIFTLHQKNRIYIQANEISEDEFFDTHNPKTEEEKALYNAAYRDFITGHFNWNYIKPLIEGYAFKGIQDFAFVHFDVKDFNTINEIYGHNVANKFLTKITQHMNKQDWIYFSARCDNDNFAMMIKDMPEEETRKKLSQFFSELSILDEDKHYQIFFRCGVVSMRNTLLLSDRVSDGAKMAQRLGTKLNETEILFYTDQMHNEIFWAKKIKAYLNTAIEKEEFVVYLQPKYDINTERIKGAEALIRWNYQGNQLISPARFVPILEKEGSINKIDDIVLKKVCECLSNWKKKGLPLYPISVNLSRKRMENPNLIEHLTSIVDSYKIDHSLIDFELTESAAYNNQDYMVSVITKLKKAGFKISMDDFGTGYSSLSLLTMMPLDTLKIDKSFVDGIGTPKETYRGCAVIKHIISMAKALNLHCLAEGAEEKTQVDKLREFGCETVQGYYYSKPLPVEEYEVRLR